MNGEELLMAFLHDPPDKALDIATHVSRAKKYASLALGTRVQGKLGGVADSHAARAERLPAPHWEFAKVGPEEGTLKTKHPLSASQELLPVGKLNEEWLSSVIRQLADQAGDDVVNRFLATWRYLPGRLAAKHPEYARLPADTRLPDHTIWQHLDITAALQAAQVESTTGAAFLSFSIGPVQSFIAAARSVRDLWTGSMILSYLTFRAMGPILEQLGPTAFVYPSLRGVPLLDKWLKKQGLTGVDEPAPSAKLAPCLPNRFLALVPNGLNGSVAVSLAEACKKDARNAWIEMADAVRADLHRKWSDLPQGWDRLWSDQIHSFFDFRTTLLPWKAFSVSAEGTAKLWVLWGADSLDKAFPGLASIRGVHQAIPDREKPGYRKEDGSWHAFEQPLVGDWQVKVDLIGRIHEAGKSIRHFPGYNPGTGSVPIKCSMFGTYEQMGPADLQESRRFWEQAAKASTIDGVRVREGERLCAVALVKRYAGPCFLRGELGLEREDLRYDDTATVAAAEWLENAGIDPDEIRAKHGEWSGQWLHWSQSHPKDEDPCPIWNEIQDAKAKHGKPPTYYAILMMDGDDLGKWLRGDKSPDVRDVMHPTLVDYFKRLGNGSKPGLDAKRPVGPALHAAISEALANFALHVVPGIVENHKGTLIYSGGDDTLVLLPTSKALECADELRKAYQSEYHKGRLMMGSKATLSAGIAIVHYKEDLRQALEIARAAEKKAKNSGKDALQITACRRSGEHSSALCPWGFVNAVQGLVGAFLAGASDRWAYHLAGELSTLAGLGQVEAMEAEIKRQVDRAEPNTRKLLGEVPKVKSAGKILAERFRDYRESTHTIRGEPRKPSIWLGDQLRGFITLCQTASFLARGRDQ